MGQEPTKKDGHVWAYEDDRTRIEINRKWCKGCEICVEFCPKRTLAMEAGKAVVADLGTCSQCMLCEIRCPDFAIEVFNLRPAKPKPVAPAAKAASAGNQGSEEAVTLCEAADVTKETEEG